MKSVSLLTLVAFLCLVFHGLIGHVGSVSSDLDAVHHAYRDAGGGPAYHEHSHGAPLQHDAGGHHHDATLLPLKTKPLVHNLFGTFRGMASLPRDMEREALRRGESSAPPPPLSLYLSKQSLLL